MTHCAVCGSLLVHPPVGRKRVYCSRACNAAVNKPGVRSYASARVCATCGRLWIARSSRAIRCSPRCNSVAVGTTRAEPLAARTCALPDCGAVFTPVAETTRCCSERHGKMLWNRESRADGRQPTPAWDDRRRDASQRRRALKKGASTGAPVRLAEIAERDDWTCKLCAAPVDASLRYPHSLSPSLDHVLPLTRGGAHDPSNVQLAHLRCNVAKGNRVEVAA